MNLRNLFHVTLFSALPLVLSLGCDSSGSEQTPPPVSPQTASESGAEAGADDTPAPSHPGQAAYERNCASCHGQSGNPTSSGRAIGAQSLSDPAVINALSDDEIRSLIAEGRGNMRAIRMDDETTAQVIEYVRTLSE